MAGNLGDRIVFDGAVEELPQVTARAGKPLAPSAKPAEEADVIDAIKLVFDPEVGVDVYNLGLIYRISIAENGDAGIDMTLTSPTCPMAEEMPQQVADTVADLEGIGEVEVKLVWEPAWDLSKMSEEAKFQMDIGDLDF
ncbi:MAG: metal-sulfur cluster assembly factor [Rickettsiales bacterium]|jgi:FeS assembly SUF system protein|nr:metal-sulfur cluster assembly factor [Rickettsiales bacterium]